MSGRIITGAHQEVSHYIRGGTPIFLFPRFGTIDRHHGGATSFRYLQAEHRPYGDINIPITCPDIY